MKRFPVFSLALLLVLLAGCDAVTDAPFTPEVVVEAFLVAGEPLTPIRLTQTAPVNARYDATALAVTDAEVAVHLLAVDGSIERTVRYVHQPSVPGRYIPAFQAGQPRFVLPTRTYRLEAILPSQPEAVTAQTLVPDLFALRSTTADTVRYQSPAQYAINVTQSTYPGRQSIFIFSTQALAPTAENLTPFYEQILGDNDGDLEDLLSDFEVTQSPPLNEGNYDVNPDGTLTISLPWFAVSFYGPQRVTVSALDDNVYDFFRSQGIQQGGSTLAPGELPNVIDRVDGGTGVFGSLARVSSEVFIDR